MAAGLLMFGVFVVLGIYLFISFKTTPQPPAPTTLKPRKKIWGALPGDYELPSLKKTTEDFYDDMMSTTKKIKQNKTRVTGRPAITLPNLNDIAGAAAGIAAGAADLVAGAEKGVSDAVAGVSNAVAGVADAAAGVADAAAGVADGVAGAGQSVSDAAAAAANVAAGAGLDTGKLPDIPGFGLRGKEEASRSSQNRAWDFEMGSEEMDMTTKTPLVDPSKSHVAQRRTAFSTQSPWATWYAHGALKNNNTLWIAARSNSSHQQYDLSRESEETSSHPTSVAYKRPKSHPPFRRELVTETLSWKAFRTTPKHRHYWQANYQDYGTVDY